MFDVGFILAVGALGWGLSLATYRGVARRRGWPMGVWQTGIPELPVAIGVVCIVLAAWAASRRIGGDASAGGWLIVLFGAAWAVFWTGFLRVGAQSALLLAPVAALLLLLRELV
ncbi:MAG: hypothetical protein HC869_25825 [Rhodospirillales bacterium]|nr:hypothetical protein [Rhodospirillales bacterium]